jgi:hypothetical protein
VNKFSYFLNPHAINVLLYRMKPRKHIHVKYCWQTYFKSIGTLSQTFKNHIHNNIVTVVDWTMGKNQNTWPHGTKIIFREINIIFHPFGSLAGFPARVIVLWQENVRGTRNASLASDRYNVVVDVIFKCLRQRSNRLKICLPAVFYMYVFS